MARRTPGLEPVKSVIPRWVHEKGPEFERKFFVHWVLWHWSDIVGDFIARNTSPQGIRKDTLYIYSDNASLRNELQMMMPQIVQSVNNYAGQQMIAKVAFSKRWEKADSEGIDEIRMAPIPSDENWGKERRKISLSAEEMQAASLLESKADDEEIGKAISGLYRKHMQMQKLQLSRNYHKCPQCGRLMEPKYILCVECSRRQREKTTASVRQVLRDMPWARYPDVKKYVPECTTKMVNEQRSIMVQKLAADIDVKDKDSIKAKTLVMLYRCLPPDKLTEDNIIRALYQLRFDMHRPKDYKAPRRYDVIKLGRR